MVPLLEGNRALVTIAKWISESLSKQLQSVLTSLQAHMDGCKPAEFLCCIETVRLYTEI